MDQPITTRFTKVPDWWQTHEAYRALPASAVKVAIGLVRHSDWIKGNGAISNPALAAFTGLSLRTAQRGLQALRLSGFIKCWLQPRPGQWARRVYHIALSPAQRDHYSHDAFQQIVNKCANTKKSISTPIDASNKYANSNKYAARGETPMPPVAHLSELYLSESKTISPVSLPTTKRSFDEILAETPPPGLV